MESKKRDGWEGDYVRQINHAMRTAVFAIQGYAEMMYDSNQSLREKLTCIGRIRRKAQDILKILEDSADLVNCESGALAIHLQRFSLTEELSDTLLDLASRANKKRVGFKILSAGLIPSEVTSDPLRVKELLITVVGAVIDRVDRGSVELRLEATNVQDSNASLVMAIDYSGTTLSGVADPSNLWLTLSQRLARLLHGDVVEQKGSYPNWKRVEVSWAIGLASEVTWMDTLNLRDLKSWRVDRPPHHPDGLQGVRILVVDDDRDMHLIAQRVFSASGAVVESAYSGSQALTMAREVCYDLILMDVEMPCSDGFETTRRLRDGGCDKPIVALTAHPLEPIRDRSIAAGCDGLVAKPMGIEELMGLAVRFSRQAVAV